MAILVGWLKGRPLSSVLHLSGNSLFEKMQQTSDYKNSISSFNDFHRAIAYQINNDATELLRDLTPQRLKEFNIISVNDGTGYYNAHGVYIDQQLEKYVCLSLWEGRYIAAVCDNIPYQLSISIE